MALSNEGGLITNFNDFQEAIAHCHPDSGHFFRGEKRDDWKLIPKIGRITDEPANDGTGRTPIDLEYQSTVVDERGALTRFKAAARPYLTHAPDNDWDWLALAQHHSLPTRLLDWSTNPLTSLFFAIGEKVNDDWLSREQVGHPTYQGAAAFYIWRVKQGPLDIANCDPFDSQGYFYPAHVSPRIVAQGGLFSIQRHPHRSFGAKCTRYVIPFDARQGLRDSLRRFGVNDALIYADLDGLSRDIQERITRL